MLWLKCARGNSIIIAAGASNGIIVLEILTVWLIWAVIAIKRTATTARWWSLFCVIVFARVKIIVKIIACNIALNVVEAALYIKKYFFWQIRCDSRRRWCCCGCSRRRRCCCCCWMSRWVMWSHVRINRSIPTDWWMGVFVRRLSASRQIIRPISLFIWYGSTSTVWTILKWSHCGQVVRLLV